MQILCRKNLRGERERDTQEGEPGAEKKFPMRSPPNNKIIFLLL
jgi:hypothetical protein